MLYSVIKLRLSVVIRKILIIRRHVYGQINLFSNNMTKYIRHHLLTAKC